MTAYYNENDPYAAEWLRNLVMAGRIAPGDVDDRSIKDVRADDLVGYRQCHFFAGIGVWSYALRQAGWSDDRSVWTGSCPCQPFSSIGQKDTTDDPRHLWPDWFGLITERNPSVVFGEQVASIDGYAWLDLVFDDLESLRYAFAPFVLPAAGFGAPHGRHRIYFVGDADGEGLEGHSRDARRRNESRRQRSEPAGHTAEASRPSNLAITNSERCEGEQVHVQPRGSQQASTETTGSGSSCGVEHAESEQAGLSRLARERRATSGYWADADWIPCRGGKWRAIEPGTFPLAHGVASRMDKIRAFGNAIVAPQAIEFVKAYMATDY